MAMARVGNKGHLSMERKYAQVQVQRGAQEPNQRRKPRKPQKIKSWENQGVTEALGRSPRRFGSPTWTPKPSKASHTFPPETCQNRNAWSQLEEDSSFLGAPAPPGRPGQ